MNKLAIAALIAIAPTLAACPGMDTVNSASSIATKTTIAANDFYTHASRAGADLVKAGLLEKETFKKADAKAYAVLIDVRAGRATFAMLVAAAAPLTGAKR